MAIWTREQEAVELERRFDALRVTHGMGQAKFARTYAVPGGASMVSQHIKGRRPINMEHALAYAKGFGVNLADISPRLAEQADVANRYASTPTPQMPQEGSAHIGSAEERVSRVSPLARQIAELFDELPDDTRLRAEVQVELTQAILRRLKKGDPDDLPGEQGAATG